MTRALGPRALLAAGCVALVVVCGTGCGSRPGFVATGTSAATDKSPAPGRSSSSARPRPSTSTPPAAHASCPRPSHGPARNLVADAATKRRLLAAGAALNNLPTADYRGLDAGLAYYAYIPATRTYWAGARLDAKPTSLRAEIAGEDAGGYLLFWRRTGGPWHAFLDGGPFKADKVACPVPPSLDRAWGWPPHARAPGPGPTPGGASHSP